MLSKALSWISCEYRATCSRQSTENGVVDFATTSSHFWLNAVSCCRRHTHFSPRPVSAAICSIVMPSSVNPLMSSASINGSTSLRCRLSISVIRFAVWMSTSITSTGIESSPAWTHATNRRLPAITM